MDNNNNQYDVTASQLEPEISRDVTASQLEEPINDFYVDDFDNWFDEEYDNKTLEIINSDICFPGKTTTKNSDDSDDSNDSNESEYIYVEDIILADVSELNAVFIIQYQCSLSHFIKAMIENITKTYHQPFDSKGSKWTESNNNSDIAIKSEPEIKIYHENNINTSPKNNIFIPQKIYARTKLLNIDEPLSRLNSKNVNKEKLISETKLKDIISYLSWISNSAELLAKRIDQEILIHKSDLGSVPTLTRSSYVFCRKSTQCKHFYNKQELPTCTNHHYVHSLLKYDIDSVIIFLKYIYDNDMDITIDQLNDLYSSIKTICFVTKNMQKEIYHIHYLTKKNSEIYHRANNNVDIHRKSNYVKTDFVNNSDVQYRPRTFSFEKKNSLEKSPIKGGFMHSKIPPLTEYLSTLSHKSVEDDISAIELKSKPIHINFTKMEENKNDQMCIHNKPNFLVHKEDSFSRHGPKINFSQQENMLHPQYPQGVSITPPPYDITLSPFLMQRKQQKKLKKSNQFNTVNFPEEVKSPFASNPFINKVVK